MRWLLGALTAAAILLSVGGVPATVPAAPLAQATATPTPTRTPTPTATPLAAVGWNRQDHPDDVRCYWSVWNGFPFGGCVVVP